MEKYISCPNCQFKITEKVISENAESLKEFNDLFSKFEDNYKVGLSKNIKKDLEKDFNINLEKQKNDLSNNFNNEILSLKNKITKLETEKQNVELNLEKDKQIIESKLNSVFKDKENELKENYQKEIELLKNQIHQLDLANMQHKLIANKTKGENFEYEVEGELRKVFSDDYIEKINAEGKKADFIHEFKIDNSLKGKIIYEVKNAEWSSTWEKKLQTDLSNAKIKYGIIVATTFSKKYKGIPFKVSDSYPNIFLTDDEGFIFVAQILKLLIKSEEKALSNNSEDKNDLVIKKLLDWRNTQFIKLCGLFEEQFIRIKENENGISKRVDDIRISREKIESNFLKVIKEFIEGMEI